MRSTPLQQRASLRVEGFLDAAADLIAEVGYEGLTMTAVAERTGASIGALYRWFPDKTALAKELRHRYADEMHALLAGLAHESPEMSVPEFAQSLIERIVDFTRRRPAWLALQEATPRPVRDPAVRRLLREQFAKTFRAFAPHLSPERSYLIANAAIGIVKGLIGSFRNAPEEDRAGLTTEFQTVLTLYLSQSLATPEQINQ